MCVVFAGGKPAGRQSSVVKLGRGCRLGFPHPSVLWFGGGGWRVEGYSVAGMCFCHLAVCWIDSHSLSVLILVIILHMKI